MSFSPYLFFTGNCAEAFAFYADVFGVEARVVTAADVPPGAEMPGVDPSTVMHAAIELDGSFLMGSDDPSGDGGPKAGFSVAYTAPDADACRRLVDALSAGGEVTLPVTETFFSPAFGMLKDRFGVAWMIDTATTDSSGAT
jgi:PhnB protein